jgi:arsenite methyltransferase
MKPIPASSPPPATDHALRERFRAAAQSPVGLFSYPTGQAGLAGLDYPTEIISALPENVLACYCGVGNPFAAGLPGSGESVLDIGCGTGVDSLVAAHCVGPAGRVAGLEFSLDMLLRGRENVRFARARAGIAAVSLVQGRAEALPFADATFDRVISNGVFNLVHDKPLALSEACRVLKPGGHMQVADQILEVGAAPACPLFPTGPGDGQETRAANWAR